MDAVFESSKDSGKDPSLVVLPSDPPSIDGVNKKEWCERDSPVSSQECTVEDDFSDLEDLQVLKVEGKDKAGRRILRIVGRFFPAPVVSGERLRNYIYQKFLKGLAEGPFCIVYIHTSVQRCDNCPGLSTLRGIYEELPQAYKERLQVVYFLHPGLRSRLLFATLGRFFLSEGLYWKLKYINRLEFLWDHIRKGQIEIPDFVHDHDEQLENRPLMDYGVETDPFQLYDMPAMGSAYSRYSLRWAS